MLLWVAPRSPDRLVAWAVKMECGLAERGGDVQRAAVHAQNHIRLVEHPNQLPQIGGLAHEVDWILDFGFWILACGVRDDCLCKWTLVRRARQCHRPALANQLVRDL